MISIPSTAKFLKDDFSRMYLELTDDEIIAQNKLKADREKRKELKRIDTGL